MARQPDDSRRGVLITPDSARRIAKAVQAYEQGRVNIKAKPLRTMGDEAEPPIRWAKYASAWPKDTAQDVEIIYKSSCDDEGSGFGEGSGSGDTVNAWNRIFDIPANARVAISQSENGCWYVVAVGCGEDEGSGSGSGSGACDCVSVGGQDLTTLPGYDEGETQVLGHQDGCLQWISTTDCGSGS